MKQEIVHLALLVRDYDEALHFYTQRLGFKVTEDTALPEPGKRWVVVSPPNSLGAGILLAKASNSEQERFVGNQSGGRVFLFLSTDDFWRDYENLKGKGVVFKREPKREAYGTVAVFEDLYGNLWDLIEYHTTAA
jgi:catechol 2,3-dioxygenase-like lactoylglutathione lyase family enzyme